MTLMAFKGLAPAYIFNLLVPLPSGPPRLWYDLSEGIRLSETVPTFYMPQRFTLHMFSFLQLLISDVFTLMVLSLFHPVF